jgi:hypothetical protein
MENLVCIKIQNWYSFNSWSDYGNLYSIHIIAYETLQSSSTRGIKRKLANENYVSPNRE